MNATDICKFIYGTIKQTQTPDGSLPDAVIGFCTWWLNVGIQLPRNA